MDRVLQKQHSDFSKKSGFLRDECGAASAEMIVVSALVIGMAFSVVMSVDGGSTQAADSLGEQIATQSPGNVLNHSGGAPNESSNSGPASSGGAEASSSGASESGAHPGTDGGTGDDTDQNAEKDDQNDGNSEANDTGDAPQTDGASEGESGGWATNDVNCEEDDNSSNASGCSS